MPTFFRFMFVMSVKVFLAEKVRGILQHPPMFSGILKMSDVVMNVKRCLIFKKYCTEI